MAAVLLSYGGHDTCSHGATIGFANDIVHDGTWSIESVCCLEDLYVDRERRARGVGRLLIDWLIAEMIRNGWAKLYWITRETNYRARALYDTYTIIGASHEPSWATRSVRDATAVRR